jgi:hypothetical protein
MRNLAIRRPGTFKIFDGRADLHLVEEGGDVYYVITAPNITLRTRSRWTALDSYWFVYPEHSTHTWFYNGKQLFLIKLIEPHLRFDTSHLNPGLLSTAPRYVQEHIRLHEQP